MNKTLILTLSLALAFSAALPALAQGEPTVDSSVFVSEDTLDAYVGTYVISAGFEIRVWREGERLMLQATGQEAWPLQGMSETVFRVPEIETKVTFGLNAAGEADQLVLFADGRETKAVRK